MEQRTGSKLGKGYIKAVYCHPAYLTYMQSTSWKMLDWMKYKLELRLPGEISITSDMQMTPQLWQKRGRTKEPLDESEREEWKSWLKTQHSENEDHGIWSHHFMANGWGNNGNSDRFYFEGAPKSLQMVTAAMKLKDTCSLQEKLWSTLLNIDSILKSRHYFANKGPSSQGYVFPSGHMDVRVGL